MFGGAVVSWKFGKQTVIARSTIESELIALDTTYLEAAWLKDLLSEFYIVTRPILSILVHTDSSSPMEILKQENANKKMNGHIQIGLRSVQRLSVF